MGIIDPRPVRQHPTVVVPDASNGDYPTEFPMVAAVLLADGIFKNLVNAVVEGVTVNVMNNLVGYLAKCGIKPPDGTE